MTSVVYCGDAVGHCHVVKHYMKTVAMIAAFLRQLIVGPCRAPAAESEDEGCSCNAATAAAIYV